MPGHFARTNLIASLSGIHVTHFTPLTETESALDQPERQPDERALNKLDSAYWPTDKRQEQRMIKKYTQIKE